MVKYRCKCRTLHFINNKTSFCRKKKDKINNGIAFFQKGTELIFMSTCLYSDADVLNEIWFVWLIYFQQLYSKQGTANIQYI